MPPDNLIGVSRAFHQPCSHDVIPLGLPVLGAKISSSQQPSRPVVLNMGTMTHLGSYIWYSAYQNCYIMIHDSHKITAEVATKVILWLGITRT